MKTRKEQVNKLQRLYSVEIKVYITGEFFFDNGNTDTREMPIIFKERKLTNI